MGLNVSPPIWQTYINTILNSLQSRKYCKAIMDDLLLFTPSKKVHMDKLEDLLKALRKNGLKISPKKCQLFRIELQYMGNTIFIKERRVCIKPLHSIIGCLHANMAAIHFSLVDFNDFTIFMLTFFTYFYIKLILYICWIAGSIFILCTVVFYVSFKLILAGQ